jgi:hypothetical protein
VASVLAVDFIYRLHEAQSSLVLDSKQEALLFLRVRHDVGEKDARFVVDEAVLVDASQ